DRSKRLSGNLAPAFASSAWNSNPLRPGNLTSSTKQQAMSGILLLRKSSADSNSSTCNPIDSSRLFREARTDASSSTTNTSESTVGCSFIERRYLPAEKLGTQIHEEPPLQLLCVPHALRRLNGRLRVRDPFLRFWW